MRESISHNVTMVRQGTYTSKVMQKMYFICPSWWNYEDGRTFKRHSLCGGEKTRGRRKSFLDLSLSKIGQLFGDPILRSGLGWPHSPTSPYGMEGGGRRRKEGKQKFLAFFFFFPPLGEKVCAEIEREGKRGEALSLRSLRN